MHRTSRTLAVAFDPRANGLNLLRLILAGSVIAWHGISLGGYERPDSIGFLSELGVDGFFAVSGFLIVRSWCNRTSVWRFSWHRFLRIMPGFWVCLVVTAAVATVIALVAGRDMQAFFDDPHSPLRYVLANSRLNMKFHDIAGTPSLGVPYPGYWNTSLWTLWWEAQCYISVAVIGLIGAAWKRLNRWAALPVLLLPLAYGTVQLISGSEIGHPVRFALMFAAGALLYLFADFVPVTPGMLLVAAAVTVPLLFFVPNYQPVAALPLAYLAVAGSTFFRSPELICQHDVSYGVYIYGYVVQQVLAILGVYRLGYTTFVAAALVLTAGVAVASWLLVERPAMRIKNARIGLPRVRKTASAGS